MCIRDRCSFANWEVVNFNSFDFTKILLDFTVAESFMMRIEFFKNRQKGKKMNILLRDLKWDDLKALEDVIRVTWNYDRFASPKTAKKLAKVYLASCLANQTFSRIAEADGLPVGIILGKDIENHHCPFKYRIRQILGAVSYTHLDVYKRQVLEYQLVHVAARSSRTWCFMRRA